LSAALVYALGGAGLCVLGLAGFALLRHLLRRLMAFNVLGSGVLLFLVGLAQTHGRPDPVPQALVLTGIVVALAATALAVVLMRRWYRLTGATELDGRRAPRC